MENADIDHSFFPASHRECGGEVAVHIDIGAAIRERLFPSPKPKLGAGLAEALGVKLRKVPDRIVEVAGVELINTLYGGPFENEGVECDCGKVTKKDPCVHCGRRVEIEYVKPTPPRFCEGPSYVMTPADRTGEGGDDDG